MNGMYWVTRGGFVVEQRGEIVRAEGRVDKIMAFNVPSGGFRGSLRLDKLRPATRHEVNRALARQQ